VKIRIILTDELVEMIRAHVPDADQMPLVEAVNLARQRDLEAAAQLEADAQEAG
jgi:hypothetical protein